MLSDLITVEVYEDDAKGIGGGTVIKVNGHTICGVTPETPQDATQRLIALCHANAPKLSDVMDRYHQAIEVNAQLLAKGQSGKFHKVFGERDRLVNQMCKQAGVIDS